MTVSSVQNQEVPNCRRKTFTIEISAASPRAPAAMTFSMLVSARSSCFTSHTLLWCGCRSRRPPAPARWTGSLLVGQQLVDDLVADHVAVLRVDRGHDHVLEGLALLVGPHVDLGGAFLLDGLLGLLVHRHCVLAV